MNNENLKTLFDKILKDHKFVEGMSNHTTIQSLYEYCLLHIKGYSINEFKEFLNSIILLNSKISGKIEHLPDEILSELSAGTGNSPKNKLIASLMGSLLITGYVSNTSASSVTDFDEIQSRTSFTQIVKKDYVDLDNQLLNNITEGVKQTIQTVSDIAEKCIGTILDVALPKASAAGQTNTKVKPKINSWPTASSIMVGQTVGESKLSGGNASVSGDFNWLPVVKNEKLVNSGKVTYICQFIPHDQDKYTKVTNTISFEVKAKPQLNVSWPTASEITYGQKIGDSKLQGGKSNVGGRFEWDINIRSTKPNVGTASCKVVFKPYDTQNYKETSSYINVKINKATPKITSMPTGSEIKYGQSLKNSKFSNFRTNDVKGSLRWVNNNKILPAGNHSEKAIFTPDDTTNYKSVEINVKVKVNKITPKLYEKNYNAEYRPNLHLYDFSLPDGWKWERPHTEINQTGDHHFNAVYHEDSTHKEDKQTITINVRKATPKPPSIRNITYDSNRKLSDISLPRGWHWENPCEIPCASKSSYKAYYDGTNLYKSLNNVDISINVYKATPYVTQMPHAEEITYRQALFDSKIREFDANVNGKIKWKNPNSILSAGDHKVTAVFTPYDSSNYNSLEIPIHVHVNKTVPKLSNKNYDSEYKPNMHLKDFSLPAGWDWEKPNLPLNEIGKNNYIAVHREDNNYHKNNETVSINIRRATPKLSLPEIVYNENTTLADIKLPLGWHFINPKEIPVISKSSYTARFDANEAQTKFYNSKPDVEIKMNVKIATPKIEEWAKPASQINYGENLRNVKLVNGKTGTPGEFKILDDTKPCVGNHVCKVEFTPENKNYESVIGNISITVTKNMNPEEPPKLSTNILTRSDRSIIFNYRNLDRSNSKKIEFSIDGGRSWQDSSEFGGLSPKTQYSFVYRYKETDNQCASKLSQVQNISTRDSAPNAPNKPEIMKYTNHDVTLKKNPLLEFSKDGGKTWQDSNIFSDLESSTKYKFISRIKETEDHIVGKSSDTTEVKTRNWFTNIVAKVVDKIRK